MATKTKKTPKDKYKPNQFVVHPHHGAAKVLRKVNKNVEIFVDGEPKSKRIQYFEIEVLTDGLLVMVPVDSCLLYTSPSPRDLVISRMPSSA